MLPLVEIKGNIMLFLVTSGSMSGTEFPLWYMSNVPFLFNEIPSHTWVIADVFYTHHVVKYCTSGSLCESLPGVCKCVLTAKESGFTGNDVISCSFIHSET